MANTIPPRRSNKRIPQKIRRPKKMNEDFKKHIDEDFEKNKHNKQAMEITNMIATATYPFVQFYQLVKAKEGEEKANIILGGLIVSIILTSTKNFDEALTTNTKLHDYIRAFIIQKDKEINLNKKEKNKNG
jgi:hypothetical protein